MMKVNKTKMTNKDSDNKTPKVSLLKYSKVHPSANDKHDNVNKENHKDYQESILFTLKKPVGKTHNSSNVFLGKKDKKQLKKTKKQKKIKKDKKEHKMIKKILKTIKRLKKTKNTEPKKNIKD